MLTIRGIPVRRLVLKIGTTTLTDETQSFNTAHIRSLVAPLCRAVLAGELELVIVSSGAVGMGLGALNLSGQTGAPTIPEKQAAAAIGQTRLMAAYEKIVGELGLVVGQVLLSNDDFYNRRRFTNATNTFRELLAHKVVAVVNENDSVAVEELKLGDNDNLAAIVGNLVAADMVVILTDQDGLYDKNPTHSEAQLLETVTEIDNSIKNAAAGSDSSFGTGGMVTKLEAATRLYHCGIHMMIASGISTSQWEQLLNNEQVGTLFVPLSNKIRARKRWLSSSLMVRGRIFLDPGAALAITSRGRSLLPSGVIGLDGDFSVGDGVDIWAEETLIARGLCNYNHSELTRIMGHQSAQIETILGYKYANEVVHRDNLVLLQPPHSAIIN